VAGYATAGDVSALITDCGSTSVEVTKVMMDGCDQDYDSACPAVKGKDVSGEIYFTVKKPINEMTCKIYAILGLVTIPFPGGCPVTNACDSLTTGKCPLAAGQDAVYAIKMNIPTIAPAVSLTGKWTLKDEQGENAMCIEFPISIQN